MGKTIERTARFSIVTQMGNYLAVERNLDNTFVATPTDSFDLGAYGTPSEVDFSHCQFIVQKINRQITVREA